MRDDALPVARLLGAAGAIVLGIAAAIATVLALLHHDRLPPGGIPVAPPAPPEADAPMLQTAPQSELADYRRAQARRAASGAAP